MHAEKKKSRQKTPDGQYRQERTAGSDSSGASHRQMPRFCLPEVSQLDNLKSKFLKPGGREPWQENEQLG